MPPKPAVDKSPHRSEIIDKLLAGESGRSISKWLKNEHGEIISHVSISNYKKNTLDIVGKAKEKIERRKKIVKAVDKEVEAIDKETETNSIIENTVNKTVGCINFLNNVVKTSTKANTKLNLEVAPKWDEETELDVEKHKLNVIKMGVPAARAVLDFYKDEPDHYHVHVIDKQLMDDLTSINQETQFSDQDESD